MTCDNCGKPITDEKHRICIHGTLQLGCGVSIGGKDFSIDPDLCSKECACEFFSNALNVIKPECETCDLYSAIRGKPRLSCDDIRCPYVKELAKRKHSDEIIQKDGGWLPHVIKTCKKFYLDK